MDISSIYIITCLADVFESSLGTMMGAVEKQFNKEMHNRIEEVDKMSRAE